MAWKRKKSRYFWPRISKMISSSSEIGKIGETIDGKDMMTKRSSV